MRIPLTEPNNLFLKRTFYLLNLPAFSLNTRWLLSAIFLTSKKFVLETPKLVAIQRLIDPILTFEWPNFIVSTRKWRKYWRFSSAYLVALITIPYIQLWFSIKFYHFAQITDVLYTSVRFISSGVGSVCLFLEADLKGEFYLFNALKYYCS